MARWDDVVAAAPDVAALAQGRIEATGMGLVATLRADGFPRISGVEPRFRVGDLWIGMMPRSRKAADLLRDPRLSLHNATADPHVRDGDAKITGRAVEASDEERDRYRQAEREQSGFDPGTEFHLFRVDVAEVATVRPLNDRLVIESWHHLRGVSKTERT